MARGLRTRVTFGPGIESDAVWSPDGANIVFNSGRSGQPGFYPKPGNGAGAEELLYADDRQKFPMSWSPDGKFLLYETVADPKTGTDLWILPDPLGPAGTAKPYPFLRTRFNEQQGQFSLDGKWTTYQSDESGRSEIYATPFPGPGGKHQVSANGGSAARWRRDNREIFYYAPDNTLTATEVTEKGGTIEIGATHTVFGGLPLRGGWYDVSADGQRFLRAMPLEQTGPTPLTLIQNWTAGLHRLWGMASALRDGLLPVASSEARHRHQASTQHPAR